MDGSLFPGTLKTSFNRSKLQGTCGDAPRCQHDVTGDLAKTRASHSMCQGASSPTKVTIPSRSNLWSTSLPGFSDPDLSTHQSSRSQVHFDVKQNKTQIRRQWMGLPRTVKAKNVLLIITHFLLYTQIKGASLSKCHAVSRKECIQDKKKRKGKQTASNWVLAGIQD